MAGPKPIYPRRATIERTIAAARAAGIKVGGFEVDPDGTIRVLTERSMPTNDDVYDRWRSKRDKAA